MIRSGAQGQPRAGNRRRAGCVWALAAALMVIFAGGALLVLAHRPLLGALGSYLVVDEPPETVEAIVAVSGEHRRRRTAMDLYQEGWAELLIFNVSDTTYYFGAPIDPVSSVVASAAERGIPSDSIVINSPICSTYE
ncbi:MAG: hypothetical protein U9P14_03995, partial [Gemmatimonadota bacterium]|nr:hypothetical protein [Gemmatimonadota bacterium]